jgi:hypothetical protein
MRARAFPVVIAIFLAAATGARAGGIAQVGPLNPPPTGNVPQENITTPYSINGHGEVLGESTEFSLDPQGNPVWAVGEFTAFGGALQEIVNQFPFAPSTPNLTVLTGDGRSWGLRSTFDSTGNVSGAEIVSLRPNGTLSVLPGSQSASFGGTGWDGLSVSSNGRYVVAHLVLFPAFLTFVFAADADGIYTPVFVPPPGCIDPFTNAFALTNINDRGEFAIVVSQSVPPPPPASPDCGSVESGAQTYLYKIQKGQAVLAAILGAAPPPPPGCPPLPDPVTLTQAHAVKVNNSGDVAGYVPGTSGGFLYRADEGALETWDPSADLPRYPALAPADICGTIIDVPNTPSVVGLNDAGTIAFYGIATGPVFTGSHAYVRKAAGDGEPARYREVGTLAPPDRTLFMIATGINDRGQVIGISGVLVPGTVTILGWVYTPEGDDDD